MSRNQNMKGNSKVLKNSTAKDLGSTISCTPAPLHDNNPSILATKSDGSIIKQQEFGLKQKLVNKVKSWSSKDKLIRNENATSSKVLYNNDIIRNENATSSKIDPEAVAVVASLTNLQLCNNNSEDNMCRSKISNARDSLEHISLSKTKFSMNDDTKLLSPKEIDVTHSECTLKVSKTTNLPKLTWDPWNKLGRKNKRENKKRKEKSPHTSREINTTILSTKKTTGCIAGDELRIATLDRKRSDDQICQDAYQYHPYKTTQKCVTFENQVDVIYFASDEIVSKASEPLKKESDQHLRNKEMRKGHIPCTLLGKKQFAHENYMSAWFKK